jgi:hypothetical protein
MFYHIIISTVHSFSLKFLSKSPFIIWFHVLVAHLSQSLHFDNGQFVYFLFQLSNLSFMIPWRILSIKGSPMCVPDLVMVHTSNQKSHLMKQYRNEAKEVERCWSNLLLQIRFLLSPADPSFEPWQRN